MSRTGPDRQSTQYRFGMGGVTGTIRINIPVIIEVLAKTRALVVAGAVALVGTGFSVVFENEYAIPGVGFQDIPPPLKPEWMVVAVPVGM